MAHYNAKNQHKPWRPSEDAKLRQMIKSGKNSEEIATELGRTRAAVGNRRITLGIKEHITKAIGSTMPYTAYDKPRKTDTGTRNSLDLKGALDKEAAKSEAAKPKEPQMKEKQKKEKKKVEVVIDSKKVAKEAKKMAKETVEKFRTVGKTVEKLFSNAKKNGLKVTITIGNSED